MHFYSDSPTHLLSGLDTMEATRLSPRVKVARLGWRPEAVPLDEPGRVVDLPELDQVVAKLLHSVEGPHPEQALFQGADEALGAAVALRRPHKSERTLDAEEGYFLRRSFRTMYMTPMPLASRARLDGSGTGPNVAPAKAAVVAAQIARSDIRESGTRRFIGQILTR